jgi:ribosomal-protein-serine acetyltransferase
MSSRIPIALEVSPSLTLRGVCVDDAATLFAVVDANRAHLRQWLPWVDANADVQGTFGFIAQAEKSVTAGDGNVMVIEEAGNICGVAGFNRIDAVNRLGTIGYWLAGSHQGRGIMTASVARLVRCGFDDLNLNRVSINAAVENHRSRAIPQRLGFQAEGTIRQVEWLYDHFVDHVVYAQLRQDWTDHRSGKDGV